MIRDWGKFTKLTIAVLAATFSGACAQMNLGTGAGNPNTRTDAQGEEEKFLSIEMATYHVSEVQREDTEESDSRLDLINSELAGNQRIEGIDVCVSKLSFISKSQDQSVIGEVELDEPVAFALVGSARQSSQFLKEVQLLEEGLRRP